MTGKLNAMIEEFYGESAVGAGFVVLDGDDTQEEEYFFKTAEEAVRHAEWLWNRTSYYERKRNHVKASRIVWEILDDMPYYGIYETLWSSAAEGRAPSGATSAFVHVRLHGKETSVPFGMDGEFFEPMDAFRHARLVQEETPAASIKIEFFEDEDEGDKFVELGIIEVD